MKNYAVLADLRVKTALHIEKAFDRGYDQGYNDGKLDGEADKIEGLEKELEKLEKEKDEAYRKGFAEGRGVSGAIVDLKKAEYDRGYNEGYEKSRNELLTIKVFEDFYQKGLKHGEELRVKEAECAEACGMKRAWEAARKILHMEQRDINKMMGGSDFGDINIIDELTPQEVIAELDAWEKKNTTTSCRKCIHAHNMHDNILTCDAVPCVIVDGHCDKYKEKQEETEKSCDNCKHNNVASGIDGTCYECIKGIHNNYEEKTEKSCVTCGHYCGYDNKFKCDIKGVLCIERDRWTPKKDSPETNVDTIENRDKIVKAIAGLWAAYGEQLWDVVADMQKNP